MSLEVDAILDRRRLRRQVGLWRGLAILAGVLALGAYLAARSTDLGLIAKPQIARVSVEGLITDDRKRLQMLDRIAQADHVKGVIVYVNSPGGTTTGGEGLYLSLRAIADKKPVVAQFGTIAASAAYITGLATDHIVARGNTITGSVGVILQWPEVSGLLDKLGVKMNELKSGPLKAEPSPFHPLPPEAREVSQEMIAEGQRWFLGLVAERRKIDPASVPGLTDGRVFSGRDAARLKLVDGLGGEKEAVRWLEETRGVTAGLDVVDWKPQDTVEIPFVRSLVGGALAALGLGFEANLPVSLTTLTLDGLLSVWQPPKN